MCYMIRNHPVKTIFVILISISSIHLIYKLLQTEFDHIRQNNNISLNTPVIYNISKSHISSDNDTNVSIECQVDSKKLRSSITVSQNEITLKALENEDWASNIVYGHWSPNNCKAKDNIAIIIPYRNRERHLNIFLGHIHPFLQKQQISYTIFVIEQAEGTKFNRAALFNTGFAEASKENAFQYNCFIFHDVDLLPTNENNFYKCGDNPIHLSVAIDKFNYNLPYNSIFGGAVAISKEQFVKMNGFSNIFFGWGGEDDDMSSRLTAVKYSIARYPKSVSRYIMIRHNSDSGNPANDARFKLLKDSATRYKRDGLTTLNYTRISENSKSKLMKFITVQFPEKEILKKWGL